MNTPYGDTLLSEGEEIYCRGCGAGYTWPEDHDGNSCPSECDRCGCTLDAPKPQLSVTPVTEAEAMDALGSLCGRAVAVHEQPACGEIVRRMWLELVHHRGETP